ncbi:hypothetical protein Q5H91_11270 [Sphingomonas sp. KR1UV-12]|uniref:Uncharacterized protein n=1 Tax=Sphingomonas aurea TaxID=3063994 RepID=A0ABT9ELW1_9SPHN|nr:hypothetical protein [Sphingomonas sp. KR1UV-12]MDP1027796.1 hypothetical protein [Sphingomonas sp. KR1UV-12]
MGGAMGNGAEPDGREPGGVEPDAEAMPARGDRDRRGWRLRRDGLTAAKRARFLAVLAETSNVERAAHAAMAGRDSFYRLRDRDAAFDAAWRQALAHGYDAVEAELLAVARGEAGGAGGFDPALAVTVLKRRDAAAAGGSGYGKSAQVAHVPIRRVWDEIERRLALVARRMGGS